MKKKILTIILALFLMLLTGCSNVDFTVIEYSDGSYREVYTVAFNKPEFEQLGATETQIQDLETRLVARLVYLGGDESGQGTEKLGYYETEFYNRIDASEQNSIKRDELKSGFSCEMAHQGATYQLIFNFADYETYRYFYGIDDENTQAAKDNLTIEKGVFTYKVIQKSKARFGVKYIRQDNSETTLGMYLFEETKKDIADVIDSAFAARVVAPTFTYTYATSSNRIHSDCDELYTNAGYNFHIWKLTIDDLDKDIHFYNTEARREMWYVVILGGALVLVLALYLVVLTKKFIEKKKQEKLNKEKEENEQSNKVIQEDIKLDDNANESSQEEKETTKKVEENEEDRYDKTEENVEKKAENSTKKSSTKTAKKSSSKSKENEKIGENSQKSAKKSQKTAQNKEKKTGTKKSSTQNKTTKKVKKEENKDIETKE